MPKANGFFCFPIHVLVASCAPLGKSRDVLQLKVVGVSAGPVASSFHKHALSHQKCLKSLRTTQVNWNTTHNRTAPPTSLTYHTIWPETDIPARYLLICEGKLPSGSIKCMCKHAVYRCRCCCSLVFVCWVWLMVRPPFSRTQDCLLDLSRDHLLRRNARCCR